LRRANGFGGCVAGVCSGPALFLACRSNSFPFSYPFAFWKEEERKYRVWRGRGAPPRTVGRRGFWGGIGGAGAWRVAGTCVWCRACRREGRVVFHVVASHLPSPCTALRGRSDFRAGVAVQLPPQRVKRDRSCAADGEEAKFRSLVVRRDGGQWKVCWSPDDRGGGVQGWRPRGTEEVFGDGFLAKESSLPKTTSVPFLGSPYLDLTGL
jgi:hypothetical protein